MLHSLARWKFNLRGLFRIIWVGVRRRELVVAGTCELCGDCCRGLNLSVEGGWIRSKRAFEKLKKKYPEYEHFEVTDRAPGGALVFRCLLLDENGVCANYDARPKFCREYPEVDIYFMGGNMLPNCGFRYEAVPSFRKILENVEKADGNIEDSGQ